MAQCPGAEVPRGFLDWSGDRVDDCLPRSFPNRISATPFLLSGHPLKMTGIFCHVSQLKTVP